MGYNGQYNIGEVINNLTGEKLATATASVRRAVSRSCQSSFICGYIASEKEKYDSIVDYIAREFDIQPDNLHEVQIAENIVGLGHSYFLDRKSEYPGSPEDVHLVKTVGFERLNRVHHPQINYRAAHDFDQSFEQREQELWDGPKILLLIHIGFSSGQEGYNRAIISATRSQFKEFLWEIK